MLLLGNHSQIICRGNSLHSDSVRQETNFRDETYAVAARYILSKMVAHYARTNSYSNVLCS